MYGQTEKEGTQWVSPVVLPLQTAVHCHAKTVRRVRNSKSGQRGTKLGPTHAQPAASCPCAES